MTTNIKQTGPNRWTIELQNVDGFTRGVADGGQFLTLGQSHAGPVRLHFPTEAAARRALAKLSGATTAEFTRGRGVRAS